MLNFSISFLCNFRLFSAKNLAAEKILQGEKRKSALHFWKNIVKLYLGAKAPHLGGKYEQ